MSPEEYDVLILPGGARNADALPLIVETQVFDGSLSAKIEYAVEHPFGNHFHRLPMSGDGR